MRSKVHVRYKSTNERWRHKRLLEESAVGFTLQITPCKVPRECNRCQAKLAYVREKLKRLPFKGQIVRRRMKDRSNHFLVVSSVEPAQKILREHFGLLFRK
jgi:hypothetical protein